MVPGFGPQPAAGLIVGEAPGHEEVKQGRPFVGKSGQLLDTVLRSVGIERDSIFVTNVVKEIPLDSDQKIRRPFPEEIEAWREILEGEIQSTAPTAILALGRTAATALTGSSDVPFGSRWGDSIFVAWHPSYVLRNGTVPIYGDWRLQIIGWAEAVLA